MKDYVLKTLDELNHTNRKDQHTPHIWNIPIYGKNRQFATEVDSSPILGKSAIKYAQRVTGSFLFYAHAIENTILPVINEIALQQTKPIETTIKMVTMLFNYLHTYPNAKIRYFASDMQLHIGSDASYLIAPKAKNQISG